MKNARLIEGSRDRRGRVAAIVTRMIGNDPIRLIIDTDPGVDDALAILMAASQVRAAVA